MGEKKINYGHREFQVRLKNSNENSRNFDLWAGTKLFKSGSAYKYILRSYQHIDDNWSRKSE